jgi:hypothetical protein
MNSLTIRYIRAPHTGNYHVTLVGHAQTAVILPRFFCRFLGVSNRAVLGSASIDATQAAALGFIVTHSAVEEVPA